MAFETALEDACVNLDLNENKPLIKMALMLVVHSVFPHRALETQCLFMILGHAEASFQPYPHPNPTRFSCCMFRKEVNVLMRKAAKKNELSV